MRLGRSTGSTISSRGLGGAEACTSSRRTGTTAVELHVSLDWGVDAAAVGAEVQRRVAEYLTRTARLPSVTVDVVVDGIAAGD